MGFVPIPAVAEPPKLLGPPVVLVQRTSDNPAGECRHHADITTHQRYENAEAVTITYFILKFYRRTLPPSALVLVFFFRHHLGTKATKICCFLT
jgi:hypothetical protein